MLPANRGYFVTVVIFYIALLKFFKFFVFTESGRYLGRFRIFS